VTQLDFLLLVLEGLGVECTKISNGILRNGEGSDQWSVLRWFRIQTSSSIYCKR